ncbi:hypothetical protein MATL_G00021050 [Megalops atlanticus]|uniref:Uncharacterized protein n=1 Tax=Megalops atlanticus TaxID=7932 RepID=A0A9D3TLZ3_MEGAT|nr:hypothetical protein MATL_G00021050 [Megalops atlanticus]
MVFYAFQQQYSYWPPSNQTRRAKHQEIPDEELWISRKIWVFATTDNFEGALRCSKTAEYKSAVETVEDQPKKRNSKRPNKFGDSSEDEGPSWTMEPPKKRKHQEGPFPRAKATVDTPKQKTDTAKLPTPRRPKQAKMTAQTNYKFRDSSPNPSPPTLATNGTDDEIPESPHSVTVAQNLVNGEGSSWPVATWESRKLQDTLQVLLQKVETLEANQREILLMLRRSQGRQREEEPALELGVAKSQAELQDLEERLKVTEFRKRVKQS